MRCMGPFEQQLSVPLASTFISWFFPGQLWNKYSYGIHMESLLDVTGHLWMMVIMCMSCRSGKSCRSITFMGAWPKPLINDPKLPMCQMMDVEKSNFWAHELLGLRGFAAIRIINLQRRWRRLRAMEDVATKMATSGTAGG